MRTRTACGAHPGVRVSQQREHALRVEYNKVLQAKLVAGRSGRTGTGDGTGREDVGTTGAITLGPLHSCGPARPHGINREGGGIVATPATCRDGRRIYTGSAAGWPYAAGPDAGFAGHALWERPET